MKKVFSLLLAIGIIISFSSCGVKSIEDACAKADKMLVQYSKNRVVDCTYEGEYTKMNGVYYYYVEATAPTLDIDSRYTAAVITSLAQRIEKEVYPNLQSLFEKFDVDVIIAVCDSRGKAHNFILNGNIQSLN